MKKSILNALGLAMKAGRLVSGEKMAESAIRSGQACFLIIAQDASQNSRKHFSDMAVFRKLPYVIWGQKEELGQAIGKKERSGIVLTDAGFAAMIQQLMQKEQKEETEGE